MPAKGSTTKIPRTCLNCGTEFLAHRCNIERGNARFCSKSCSTSYRNRMAARAPIERSCLECGTAFLVLDTSSKKYCSHGCFIAHHFGSDIKERFWSKVDQRGPDECWEWQSGTFDSGYGAVGFRGTLWKASRVAWTLTHGDIPDSLWVLHECDNPPCCNPTHLFLGTPADNSADRDDKGRVCRTHGSARWVSKLTESDVIEIRRRYADGGVRQQDLANEFGISFQNISLILLRKTWTHI